jgi:formylglycine-generating enzyme required for sulfatase activity
MNKDLNVLTFTVNGISFTMKLVKAGTFLMGATSEMLGRSHFDGPDDDELPVHEVTISNDFFIAETPVTQALWKAVMGNGNFDTSTENSKKFVVHDVCREVIDFLNFFSKDNSFVSPEEVGMQLNPSWFKGDDRRPVESVSYFDCQDFIKKLNLLIGENFSLPTEAEWEYAARGGQYSKRTRYAGSNDINLIAWCGDNSGYQTHPVAQKLPNELGLYDINGNVWEWCADWFNSDFYKVSPKENPICNIGGEKRVIRGGAYSGNSKHFRLSHRNALEPNSRRGNNLGLRLVLRR